MKNKEKEPETKLSQQIEHIFDEEEKEEKEEV